VTEKTGSFAFRCNKAAQTAATSLELRSVTPLTGSMQVVNRYEKPADVSVLTQDDTKKSLKKQSAHFRFQEPQIVHKNVDLVYPTYKNC
jgi:hypothetical protein